MVLRGSFGDSPTTGRSSPASSAQFREGTLTLPVPSYYSKAIGTTVSEIQTTRPDRTLSYFSYRQSEELQSREEGLHCPHRQTWLYLRDFPAAEAAVSGSIHVAVQATGGAPLVSFIHFAKATVRNRRLSQLSLGCLVDPALSEAKEPQRQMHRYGFKRRTMTAVYSLFQDRTRAAASGGAQLISTIH